MFTVYQSLIQNMEQKESQISLYSVQRELRQVAIRCFDYSEGSGQVFYLVGTKYTGNLSQIKEMIMSLLASGGFRAVSQSLSHSCLSLQCSEGQRESCEPCTMHSLYSRDR